MKKKILYILLAIAVVVVMLGAAVSCQTAGEGKYDFDYGQVSLAGTEPVKLTDYQRAVLVEYYVEVEGTEQLVGYSSALGWVYDQKYVVAPIQLFYVMSPIGAIPAWSVPEIKIKAYLLPDTRVEDDWQKEELGKITVNEDLQIVVVERVNPILNVKTDYTLGKYEDVSVGNVLYAVSQANGRMAIESSAVSEVYAVQDTNLFSDSRSLMFNELGGLVFALRDGKPELVGFLNYIEPADSDPNTVYVYYINIHQIIDFIKTIK